MSKLKLWGCLSFCFCIFASLAICGEEVTPFEQMGNSGGHLDLAKVFFESPVIYSILLFLSVTSLVIWSYTMLTLRVSNFIPPDFFDSTVERCKKKQYASALKECEEEKHFFARIACRGLELREQGYEVIMQVMEGEGKRASYYLWQRIDLLQDIANTAPMLGLLGTVLGLFYAFYDTAQSVENLSSIFDGLGIAIGTTVFGLIVSLLATCFCTLLRNRVIRLFTTVEEQVYLFARCLKTTAPAFAGETADESTD